MNVQFSERALWDMWQFTMFNYKGILDTRALLEAQRNGLQILYQMDFSEIHPYIFPERAKAQLNSDDLALHGRSIKFLWESLLDTELSGLPFRFAMNPGTRFEILESFWHAEKRVNIRFKRYLPDLDSSVDYSSGNIEVKDADKLRSALADWDHKRFMPKLRSVVSDDAISDQVRTPVQRLLELLDNETLRNLEECVPEQVVDEALKDNFPEDIFRLLEDFFRQNPRDKTEMSDWTDPHEHFHNVVDELNLCLTHVLRNCQTDSGFYIPLLTHTYRVISAGNKISLDPKKDPLVHHSVAPLYWARASRLLGEGELSRFFNVGNGLVREIREDLRHLSVIDELEHMEGRRRQKRFNEERFVRIPERLFKRLRFFKDEYYKIVDTAELLELEDDGQGAPDAGKDGPVKVEEFVELLDRKHKTVEEVREHARIVKAMLGNLDEGLAGLYIPRKGHAKDVSDWLNDL